MNKEKYDYTKDITDEHKHRPKILEIEPEWEIDKVSIVFVCKDESCYRLGVVEDVQLLYSEEDVEWQQ